MNEGGGEEREGIEGAGSAEGKEARRELKWV